jgi:hypothetical protein
MLLQEVVSQFMVGNVPFHEAQAQVLVRADEIPPVPRAGEVVEDDKALQPSCPEEVADQGGPDESSAPGEEDGAELAHAEE